MRSIVGKKKGESEGRETTVSSAASWAGLWPLYLLARPFSSWARGVVNTAWDPRKTVPKKHIFSLLTKCRSRGPEGGRN